MPGESADRPLYMRIVHDHDGQVQWHRVALALVLAVATGYLTVRAQRAGSMPDVGRQAKMRALHAIERTAHQAAAGWQRVEGFAKTAYEIERL